MSDHLLEPMGQVLGAAKIVDSLGLPVVATTIDGTIVAWNRAAEAVYGYAARDAIGQNVVDLLVPLPLGAAAAEALEAVARGETWSGEFVVNRADGSALRIQAVNSPVFGLAGEVVGIVGIGRDITEDVLTEQALVDSRDALGLALAAGRLGTWRWDMATGAIHWDTQLEAIFGLPPGAFDGRFETYQSLLHPEDRADVLQVVRAALENKSEYEVEHRCLWPDGSVHWLQGRGSATVDANGNVTGTVGCVGDVTERVLRRGQAVELSASLQSGLLPRLAAPAGVVVRSRYRPGEERLLLGGDFLDVAITPSGNTAFCVGDVSGHGAVPAAVGVSLRAGWRALALTSDDPLDWLGGCADLLATSDPPEELFVTMTTGFVSADNRRAVVVVAGHPPPILCAPGGVHALRMSPCLPLGLFSKDQVGEPMSFDLPAGWALLFFTDGLYEGHAEPGGSERLGVEQVEKWCSERVQGSFDENDLDDLIGFVERANGGPVVDDIAVLVLAERTLPRLC